MTTMTKFCTPKRFLAWDDETLAKNADLVLNAAAVHNNRPLWLEVRRRGIGGSDAAAVMGEGRFGSNALSVWLDKMGRIEEDQQTSHAMEFGILFEAPVAEYWERRNGIHLSTTGMWRSKHWPSIQVSPDRLADCGGGYEGKAQGQWMGKSWGTDDAPVIPRYYWWQGLVGMAVTGFDHWHFGTVIGGQTPIDRVMHIDDPAVGGEDGLAEKMEVLDQWWYQHVTLGIAPAQDESVLADLDELGAHERVQAKVGFATMIDRQRDEEISETIKALEEEQKEIRDRAAEQIGSARVLMVDDFAAFIKVRRKGSRRLVRKKLEAYLYPWQIKACEVEGSPSSYVKRAGKNS